jgi:hypothetical protein
MSTIIANSNVLHFIDIYCLHLPPFLYGVSMYYICGMKCIPVSQMRAVDLAEMLRELLEAKINKCEREIRNCTITIEADRILAQIMAYQGVQAKIQDLVIENESKDTKIRI